MPRSLDEIKQERKDELAGLIRNYCNGMPYDSARLIMMATTRANAIAAQLEGKGLDVPDEPSPKNVVAVIQRLEKMERLLHRQPVIPILNR